VRFKIFLAILGFVSLSASGAQTSNGQLIKSCENKTLIFNKQGDLVGQNMDGFCSGYLRATLDELENSKNSECKVPQASNDEYLYSVYQTYQKDKKITLSEGASNTLLQAFKRAFDCK
jgi:hypothetical protein